MLEVDQQLGMRWWLFVEGRESCFHGANQYGSNKSTLMLCSHYFFIDGIIWAHSSEGPCLKLYSSSVDGFIRRQNILAPMSVFCFWMIDRNDACLSYIGSEVPGRPKLHWNVRKTLVRSAPFLHIFVSVLLDLQCPWPGSWMSIPWCQHRKRASINNIVVTKKTSEPEKDALGWLVGKREE